MPTRSTTSDSLIENAKDAAGDAIKDGISEKLEDVVGFDPHAEIDAIRVQIDNLRQRLASTVESAKVAALHVVEKAETTAKTYPVSTGLTLAAFAGGLAFFALSAIAAPKRSRYERSMDEIQDLYDRLRARF